VFMTILVVVASACRRSPTAANRAIMLSAQRTAQARKRPAFGEAQEVAKRVNRIQDSPAPRALTLPKIGANSRASARSFARA
jgi:hypothetical protein